MFENLLDLVKQHAGDAIVNNPEIPNQHNNDAIHTATSSIFDGLKGALAGGNITDLVSMFNSGGANNVSSNPLSQGIQSSLIQSLMGKFGLNQGAAGNIASSLIPIVLQKLVHKTNDPNDNSFNIQSILGGLTGGGASGGAGGFDIGNLISQFTGGGNQQQQQQQSGGGGILDTIKGLFGK